MSALSSVTYLLTALGVALALPACDSSADADAKLAKLSSSCRINSDCGEPLVCVFERCHEQCASSRDCDGDARCVQSPQTRNVCQLPDEQSCDVMGACPGEQVCGVDGECRDACGSDGECLTEQVCSAGTCADVTEVDDAGQLTPARERPEATFIPCAFDSDCPGSQICSAGKCAVECVVDDECGASQHCASGACQALATEGRCRRNSDCADSQRCSSGECVPLETEPEAECDFDSDCEARGQHCVAGSCTCECATSADCAPTRVCVDACACEPNRVIDGDVVITNERELYLLNDVVEITGQLQLHVRGGGEYHLRSLRTVGDIEATESTGAFWFDALEEVKGSLRCYQSCRAPHLKQVGDLSMSPYYAAAISFPELETATGDVNLWYAPRLTQIDLPKLRRAKSFRVVSNSNLTEVSMPELAHVETLSVGSNDRLTSITLPKVAPTYDVDISHNKLLRVASLPSLSVIENQIYFANNPRLEVIEFPALTQAYGFYVQLMPRLSTLKLPALTRVLDNLYFSTTATPAVLELPALERVGSFTMYQTSSRSIAAPRLEELKDLHLGWGEIETIDLPLQRITGQLLLEGDSLLRTLKLSAATSIDQIDLAELPELESMDLSAMTTNTRLHVLHTGLTNLTSLLAGQGGSFVNAGTIEISYNPALPECAVTTLAALLTESGWQGAAITGANLQCECEGAVCQ